MEPTDALELENLIASRVGITVRPGYVNHVINIGDSITTDVRTVAGFRDVTGDQTAAARDKLFAFTDQGIYDVTNSGGSNPTLMGIYDASVPATKLTDGWGVKGGIAGWVSYVNFTTAAAVNGKHYLIACDLLNGYHYYDPDGGGAGVGRWYKVKEGNSGPGAIEGINPTKLVQVCSWKGRLIFAEGDSSRAWYLTPGTITGTGASKPVAIDMGSRFNVGGWLKGCYTWTYDGGAGIDDFLVAISAGGDVVVWQGISPSDANFQIKGVWQLGSVPLGRRIASDYGGDILLLSASGVLPISQLVSGGASDDKYVSYKVQPIVREYFKNHGDEFGWSIHELSSYGLIIINGPPSITGRPLQLAMATQTEAWTVLGDIPSRHWESFRGNEYFATSDGRVCQFVGYTDTQQLAKDSFEESDIIWKGVTAYQSGDAPANWKRVHFVRPLFVASQLPTYDVKVIFDFATAPPATVDPPPTIAGSKWDLALWDINQWGGSLITEQPVIGAAGYGRWFAVSLSGRSKNETSVVGFDLIGEIGGML
jgi:hypothetical protein